VFKSIWEFIKEELLSHEILLSDDSDLQEEDEET